MPFNDARKLCLAESVQRGLKALCDNYGRIVSEQTLDLPFKAYTIRDCEDVMLRTLIACYDHNTYAHAQRIVHLAEAMGCYLRLCDESIRLIGLAALLHDVGKIGLPQTILNKPGPLNDEEWEIMRLHPEIGQQMLTLAGGVFQSLAPIVLAHHERWDGCGYPAGLVGEAIPIAARILAVVDSYDAMTSYRPYQKTLSVAEAYAELRCCSGSQYDPRVIAAFFAVLRVRNVLAPPLSLSAPPFTAITQGSSQPMMSR
jgi:HD-GYP domain-containing protein (c-di-GMP phosphodiesterase class II)